MLILAVFSGGKEIYVEPKGTWKASVTVWIMEIPCSIWGLSVVNTTCVRDSKQFPTIQPEMVIYVLYACGI